MIKELILAAGCFWCIESDFEKVDGVQEVISGYAGGELEYPTYRDHEGHREVVKVIYDSTEVSYGDLVEYFYLHVDYEDDKGQFCDRGYAYSPAIWVPNGEDLALTWDLAPEESVVPIYAGSPEFWKAEEYHQDYYLKNPFRYNYYRWGCGRDKRLQELR